MRQILSMPKYIGIYKENYWSGIDGFNTAEQICHRILI